jgi:hypothetical protein
MNLPGPFVLDLGDPSCAVYGGNTTVHRCVIGDLTFCPFIETHTLRAPGVHAPKLIPDNRASAVAQKWGPLHLKSSNQNISNFMQPWSLLVSLVRESGMKTASFRALKGSTRFHNRISTTLLTRHVEVV